MEQEFEIKFMTYDSKERTRRFTYKNSNLKDALTWYLKYSPEVNTELIRYIKQI